MIVLIILVVLIVFIVLIILILIVLVVLPVFEFLLRIDVVFLRIYIAGIFQQGSLVCIYRRLPVFESRSGIAEVVVVVGCMARFRSSLGHRIENGSGLSIILHLIKGARQIIRCGK